MNIAALKFLESELLEIENQLKGMEPLRLRREFLQELIEKLNSEKPVQAALSHHSNISVPTVVTDGLPSRNKTIKERILHGIEKIHHFAYKREIAEMIFRQGKDGNFNEFADKLSPYLSDLKKKYLVKYQYADASQYCVWGRKSWAVGEIPKPEYQHPLVLEYEKVLNEAGEQGSPVMKLGS